MNKRKESYIHDTNIDLIFHYTSSENALQYILANSTLRFGPFENVNDPKESKSRRLKLTKSSHLASWSINQLEINESKMNNILLKQSRLICFTMDNKYKPKKYHEDEGILYRRGFFKSRMWAQYGDNHKGVCLAFDRDKLIDVFKGIECIKKYRGSVTYSNLVTGRFKETNIDFDFKLIAGMGFEKYFIEHQLVEYRKSIFFQKCEDWRDENEYRLLAIFDEGSNDQFLDISDSISAIYLGVDFDRNKMNSLRLITERKIPIYQLDMEEGYPEISAIYS